jgi:ABC-type cobalamin/Fe3+-siderophores transport system ATPase subunit
MLVEITLFPELTEPLGLEPAPTLDGFGDLVVIAGQNGAGKTRVLSLVMRMIEDAARAEQARERCEHVIGVLERRIAAGEGSTEELQQELASERVRLAYLARVADAIKVDGPEGPERPTARDTCIMFRHPWTDSSGPLPADRVFGGTGAVGDRGGSEFAATYREVPAALADMARALFYAGHPQTARHPSVIEAAHGAEELNRLLESLIGKTLEPGLEVVDDKVELVFKLGGRRLGADELSSGERILITWALLLHRKRNILPNALILIDEPETHLHPDALIRLLSHLREQVKGGRGQIWITSHSPSLFFYAGTRSILMIEDGAIRRLGEDEIPRLLRGRAPSEPGPMPAALAEKARFAVGTSDFRKLRHNKAAYVDKTGFVEAVLANPAEVLLIPRPRRFGKTLNLSTLRYFVEKSNEDRTYLFQDLAVWRSTEARQHFGRYPVIYLTFKDVKQQSWESCFADMAGLVAEVYGQHSYLLEGDTLEPHEKEVFAALLQRRAAPELCRNALRTLSRHLYERHGEPVVILIDEYDTPLHEAFARGYYDEAVAFFRNFLSSGLKDNEYLFKGVLTGILRVAKESLFSGLNNLAVYTLLRPEFATSFGFTEDELRALTEELGEPDLLNELRDWYNGYLFGGQMIYNPWSVVSFLASTSREPRPYWVDTSSNELLERLLFRKGLGLRNDMELLLRGETISKRVEEDIVLRDLERTPDAVWSLLLFSGYLRPASGVEREQQTSITIPNKEVRHAFEKLTRSFIEQQLGGGDEVQRMLDAMFRGDGKTFERYLARFLLTSMSYLDPAVREPEKVYHAFVLGILLWLRPEYEVISNIESGFGRVDLRVRPWQPGHAGVVLELKVLDASETAEHALESALGQIEEKSYTAPLVECGAQPIHTYAVVFDGKQVWVRRGS